jgi:hypothetical protein
MKQYLSVLMVLFLAACQVDSGAGFDRRKIDEQIVEVARKRTMPAVDIKCPRRLWLRPGDQFDCQVSGTPDDAPHVAKVTLGNYGRVYVTWDGRGSGE